MLKTLKNIVDSALNTVQVIDEAIDGLVKPALDGLEKALLALKGAL